MNGKPRIATNLRTAPNNKGLDQNRKEKKKRKWSVMTGPQNTQIGETSFLSVSVRLFLDEVNV